jgi:proteasome lid subunit RPN8/RPN11
VIRIAAADLARVVAAAEAAYPQECCGLLAGRAEGKGADRAITVTAVHPSSNIAREPHHTFEIDPALRLRLQRELRDSGDSVVGLYHSHPDGRAQPSATDLDRAWEPDLAWLITAVQGGQAILTTAHVLEVGAQVAFRHVPLVTQDWQPPASRAARPEDGIAFD